jgi:hypothetical protein
MTYEDEKLRRARQEMRTFMDEVAKVPQGRDLRAFVGVTHVDADGETCTRNNVGKMGAALTETFRASLGLGTAVGPKESFAVLPIPENINPGIRDLVSELNSHGWRTTDSGDGHTHRFECDRPNPYVCIIARPELLFAETLLVVQFFTQKGCEVISGGPEDLENLPTNVVNIEAGILPTQGFAWIDISLSRDSPLVKKPPEKT